MEKIGRWNRILHRKQCCAKNPSLNFEYQYSISKKIQKAYSNFECLQAIVYIGGQTRLVRPGVCLRLVARAVPLPGNHGATSKVVYSKSDMIICFNHFLIMRNSLTFINLRGTSLYVIMFISDSNKRCMRYRTQLVFR